MLTKILKSLGAMAQKVRLPSKGKSRCTLVSYGIKSQEWLNKYVKYSLVSTKKKYFNLTWIAKKIQQLKDHNSVFSSCISLITSHVFLTFLLLLFSNAGQAILVLYVFFLLFYAAIYSAINVDSLNLPKL